MCDLRKREREQIFLAVAGLARGGVVDVEPRPSGRSARRRSGVERRLEARARVFGGLLGPLASRQVEARPDPARHLPAFVAQGGDKAFDPGDAAVGTEGCGIPRSSRCRPATRSSRSTRFESSGCRAASQPWPSAWACVRPESSPAFVDVSAAPSASDTKKIEGVCAASARAIASLGWSSATSPARVGGRCAAVRKDPHNGISSPGTGRGLTPKRVFASPKTCRRRAAPSCLPATVLTVKIVNDGRRTGRSGRPLLGTTRDAPLFVDREQDLKAIEEAVAANLNVLLLGARRRRRATVLRRASRAVSSGAARGAVFVEGRSPRARLKLLGPDPRSDRASGPVRAAPTALRASRSSCWTGRQARGRRAGKLRARRRRVSCSRRGLFPGHRSHRVRSLAG